MGICNKCGGTGLIPPAWTVTYKAIAPTKCARCNGKGAIDPALPLAKGWKKVMYFGHELIVPVWVRWLVSDMNGLVGGFEAEPRAGKIYWLGDDSEATNILMYLNLNGMDWRETLREV